MQTEILEVKNSIYAGMSIYKTIEKSQIELNNKVISNQDKKYLSLYLGILNTNNKISNLFKRRNKRLNIQVSFSNLSMNEYINIYKDSFIEILNQVDFNSIEGYLKYLLTFDIINDINKYNNIDINQIIVSNKQLIKK